MSFLIDTDVAIRHLRGHREATGLLSEPAKDGLPAISTVTRVEIRQGMLDRERTRTERFLDSPENLSVFRSMLPSPTLPGNPDDLYFSAPGGTSSSLTRLTDLIQAALSSDKA